MLFFPYEGAAPLRLLTTFLEPDAADYLASAAFQKETRFTPAADYAAYVGGLLAGKGFGLTAFVTKPLSATLTVFALCFAGYYFYIKRLRRENPVLAGIVDKIIASILPPIILIFLVLGTIFRGIATPTEGGAAGAVGALLLAWKRKSLNFPDLKTALEKTLKLSGFVMFILVGARIFSVIFYNLNGHHFVENLFAHLPGGEIGFLIAVNAMIFLLAFFLDFFELAFIVVPLLAPLAAKLGIDLVWFGVMIGMNMQTSFLHPPFGFSLFFLRSVAPKEAYADSVTGKTIAPVTTGQIYRGAIPFLVMQLLAVALIVAFPGLVIPEHNEVYDLSRIYQMLPERPQLPDVSVLHLIF